MSDAERQSPRTAIRSWLQHTDSKSPAKPSDAFSEQKIIEWGSRHHSRRYHKTRYMSGTKDQHDEEAGREHQRHNESRKRQKRVTNRVPLVNSHQARPQIHTKDNATVNSDGFGLAARLGLHAPFRAFREQSDNEIPDAQARPRKRRRSRSSTSSYLEPAAANDLSDIDHGRPTYATILRTASTGPEPGDRGNKIVPRTSQDSETVLPSPDKLLKSYERRPRHKTRQDRYEFKDNNRDSEKTKQAAKKDRREQKQTKHKRKEKSGAALMNDFAAQNVAHDRLTLKPVKTLGLFGKGRASLQVRRRGLPDLAFSEMTFLNSYPEKPKRSSEYFFNRHSDKNKRRKSTKLADTGAGISRYFMSVKPTSLDLTTSHDQRYQQDRRPSRDHESPQALVNLPNRPFLGFGSCGPNTSISPVKIPVNTESRSLHRRYSRSLTPSTSYPTRSQSWEPPSSLPEREHHFEPSNSPKLSNRKRTSPTPHKGRQSVPPISPPCVQMTVSRTQNTTSKTSSKHEEANEAPGQDSESCLSIDGGHRSKDKIESHGDTRTIELDTASVSRDIENSILDNKHQAIAATHDGIESALPPQNHAVCLSSGCGPRCEPQAHDVRPLSAQMPVIPPHKDPLDDILERLRMDSHTNVAGGDPASHATSRDRNFPVSEEARVPDTVQEHSRMPPHAFVNNIYAPEAPVSASKSSRKPCSASLRLASAHDGSRSSQTLSRGSLHSSNRPGIDYAKGYPLIRPQSQVDSRNAWNDYENLYERQQEQADLTPENLREHRPPYTAREDLSSLLRETDHAAAPDEYAQIIHPVDSGGESDDYMPYMYKMLQEENDDGNYQGIRHSERDDQFVDYVACYDPRASRFDESHEGCNDGIMAETNVNDYQQRGTNADHEHSFAQGAVQYEPEPQLFTTNITDTYSSWRPRDIFGGNYGLERCAADAQVHDVNPALSRFWAPHKLY